MKSFKSFFYTFWITLFVLILANALPIIIADPLSMFHSRRIDFTRIFYGDFTGYFRTVYPTLIPKLSPKTIILGPSFSFNIPVDQLTQRHDLQPIVNLSLPAGTIYEQRRLLEHTINTGNLKTVVMGLNFSHFQRNNKWEFDWSDDNYLNVGESSWLPNLNAFYLLLSRDLSQKSLALLNPDKKPDQRDSTIQPAMDELYYRFGVAANCICVNNDPLSFREDNYLEFRKILELVADHHLDIFIFLSPNHLYSNVLLEHLGALEHHVNWKKRLLDEVENVKKRTSQKIELWDFTETQEVVEWNPSQINYGKPFDIDPAHYNRKTAAAILARMLNEYPADAKFTDFGIALSDENFVEVMAKQLQYIQQQKPALKKYINFINQHQNVRIQNRNWQAVDN